MLKPLKYFLNEKPATLKLAYISMIQCFYLFTTHFDLSADIIIIFVVGGTVEITVNIVNR